MKNLLVLALLLATVFVRSEEVILNNSRYVSGILDGQKTKVQFRPLVMEVSLSNAASVPERPMFEGVLKGYVRNTGAKVKNVSFYGINFFSPALDRASDRKAGAYLKILDSIKSYRSPKTIRLRPGQKARVEYVFSGVLPTSVSEAKKDLSLRPTLIALGKQLRPGALFRLPVTRLITR